MKIIDISVTKLDDVHTLSLWLDNGSEVYIDIKLPGEIEDMAEALRILANEAEHGK